MDAQSYSLRRGHNRWIVCAAGSELMACADKRTALRIIRAATALKHDRALSNNPSARTSSTSIANAKFDRNLIKGVDCDAFPTRHATVLFSDLTNRNRPL